MNLHTKQFWQKYISTLKEKPTNPNIEISIAGNLKIADELLQLYLDCKKFAGSTLLKVFEQEGIELPKIGDYWIVLDSQQNPKCINKVVKVEIHLFKNITKQIAIAEEEGDSSTEFWKKAHKKFYEPHLKEMKITDIENEKVVTEFFEIVFK